LKAVLLILSPIRERRARWLKLVSLCLGAWAAEF
jgi:hypothetical protein